MTYKRYLISLLFALLPGALPGYAQQAQSGAAQDNPERETSAPEASTTPADQPASAPHSTTTTPNTDNNSPFDYRSSEEISEDLPVSFPVDI